ncbi:cyclin-dependent kinase inhibitor 1B-like [Hyperolius riggenbachi]|uniref:cyclin-dependent kinase inhibitor 1B-like n=1 Tax=Hyperolius riggenbachi TaxID=752182 RepID=UPI0035A35238
MAAFNVALQEDSMPALPRMALGSPGRGVCRSLFGPIDHDELRSELKRQLKEIQASDCQRWNFDFEAGTPLKGIFCWEPLESTEMPSFYRESRLLNTVTAAPVMPRQPSPPQQQQCPLNSRPTLAAPDVREEAPAEPVGTRENPKCAKENAEKTLRKCQGVKGPSRTPTQLRKRETRSAITDYFPKRKRLQPQHPKLDTNKVVSSFCTLEQTPRKKIR